MDEEPRNEGEAQPPVLEYRPPKDEPEGLRAGEILKGTVAACLAIGCFLVGLCLILYGASPDDGFGFQNRGMLVVCGMLALVPACLAVMSAYYYFLRQDRDGTVRRRTPPR